jgi:hypothetical protein
MGATKGYLWLFPLISGIFSLIAISTPIAYYDSSFNIWMWGLIHARIFDREPEFIDEKLILSTGIVLSLIILIISFALIITGLLFRRGYMDDRKISITWISFGVVMIASTIISVVSLDYYTYYGNFPYGMWDLLDPGFGAIGPIMAGITIIIIGIYILTTKMNTMRKRKPPIRIYEAAPKSVCPHCGKAVSLNATFCSKCGKNIE